MVSIKFNKNQEIEISYVSDDGSFRLRQVDEEALTNQQQVSNNEFKQIL